MKILLLGASGATGRVFVRLALNAGHEVGAFVRQAGKVPFQAGLTEFKGDALEPASLLSALEAFRPDVVVSTLGTRGSEIGSLAEALGPLVGLLEKTGIGRFVFLSSIGVGESAKHFGLLVRWIVRRFFGKALIEKERQERAIVASGLDWTIVRPGTLIDEPVRGTWSIIEDTATRLADPRIARADLAAFLLEEATACHHFRKAVTIVSP